MEIVEDDGPDRRVEDVAKYLQAGRRYKDLKILLAITAGLIVLGLILNQCS